MQSPSLASPGARPGRTSHWRKILDLLVHGPDGRQPTERNVGYLYREIAWGSVVNAASSFNAAFILRLGAPNALVGWLSSVPSLITVLFRIPSARFLEARASRQAWIAGSCLVACLGPGFLVVLPWLLQQHRAEVAVAILLTAAIPRTFFDAGWNPMLADIVPEPDRTRVFATRMAVESGLFAGLTLLAGQWLVTSHRLGWASFPLNYQVLYAVGFIGAVLSTAYIGLIRLPATKAAHTFRGEAAKPFLSDLKAMLVHNRDYRAMLLNTFTFDSGAWLAEPVMMIYFVRGLGASDGWIGLNSALANLGRIAGYLLWRRALRRVGYRRGLLSTAPIVACHALLVGLFPSLALILVWGVMMNLAGPGLDLSHMNIMLQICPEARRGTYLATFDAITNLGAFVTPMIGVALVGVLGVRPVLFIGGGLRLLGAVLFWLNPFTVGEVELRW